jgi:hypothetical protein
MRPPGSTGRSLLAMLVAVAAAMALPAAAGANAPITTYSALPSAGQAGGHPDVEIHFAVENRVLQHSQSPCNCEDAKDAIVHLPPGFIGNPHATPQCSIAEFSGDECPIDSQVGIANVNATGGIPFDTAVYNIIPPPDVAGLLGFKIFLFDTPQFTVLSARTGGDYGLDADTTSIFHGIFPLQEFREQLWGVPADASHDALRLDRTKVPGEAPSYIGELCDADGSLSTDDPNTIVQPCQTNFIGLAPVHSNSPLNPFLQNPTTCADSLRSSLDVLSYDGGTDEAGAPWPEMTGCDQLSFNPSLYAQPTTSATDSASGIEVNLSVPQQFSPTIPSPTELRGATVTLPEGFSINSNAADGKTSCSDSAANFGTTLAAHCPDFAKVGSLTIDSSALPGPLPGFIYLGQPLPGNRYRIFLVADGFATHVKLAGTVKADPLTGRLTVTFTELPQSPLTSFDMHFFGSERGLLATPTQCGTYPVESTFEPWDASLGSQRSTQYFTLTTGPYGAPCPAAIRPFEPGFHAASSSHSPGSHASFSLELWRADGQQNLAGLTVATPPGFLATLAGVPYCSEAAIAHAADAAASGLTELESPSCPAASRVGSSIVGVGAGTHPLYVPGNAYLAGPYRGAPLSLVVITPGVAGPYDLGNVVVRAAINVDPVDAHVTTVADRLPSILEGIPLRLRSIRVNLDRPGFALNPTNCSALSVNARVLGDQGGTAALSNHFQVANCGTLPFGPKLDLQLSGSTRRSGNPALHATVTARPGEANISSAVVTLPHTEFLDNAHIKSPCTRVQFAASACPASTVIGHARAETPLLAKALEGPVYLRSSSHKLPDVVATLHGQIDIELDGRITATHGRLRTHFENVPDAPVSTFTLNLIGGKKGLLENGAVENICSAPQVATMRMTGQNGALESRRVPIGLPCHRHGSHGTGSAERRHRRGVNHR